MSCSQFRARHYFERYAGEDFDGVTLEELPDLEKLFELNIYVYIDSWNVMTKIQRKLRFLLDLFRDLTVHTPAACISTFMEVISAISRTSICTQSLTIVQNATSCGKQRKP